MTVRLHRHNQGACFQANTLLSAPHAAETLVPRRGAASFNKQATIWKNLTPTRLTDGTTTASVEGLAISGTDIYAVGTVGTVPTLWKNNQATTLSADGGASAICVVTR